MTDEEARELIEENIRLIRDSFHWGQIIIEINEGKIRRVNLTVNAKPRTDKICDKIKADNKR